MADKAAVVGWLIPFSEEEIKKLIPLCGEEVLFNNRCKDYFRGSGIVCDFAMSQVKIFCTCLWS